MKRKQLLHVYVVHQFATQIQEHRILGVYLDKEQAENHARALRLKRLIDNSPYVAVTKHTARGQQSSLLQVFNNPKMIRQKGKTIFLTPEFIKQYEGGIR